MRKKIITGNWKMNVKPSETAALVKDIAEATKAYTNVDSGRAAHHIDVGVGLGRLRDLLHERRRLGRLDVHLPVSGNDFLAHFCCDLSC